MPWAFCRPDPRLDVGGSWPRCTVCTVYPVLCSILIVVKLWKQANCPSIDEWVNKLLYIHGSYPESNQPCTMKNRDIYWRKHKIQEILYRGQWCLSCLQSRHHGTSNSSPNCHQLPVIFSWISATVWNLFPFKGDYDMIVYIESPIDSTKTLLGQINEFGKTVGYKVNIQKLKAILYSKNDISETEIRKKTHLL